MQKMRMSHAKLYSRGESKEPSDKGRLSIDALSSFFVIFIFVAIFSMKRWSSIEEARIFSTTSATTATISRLFSSGEVASWFWRKK